LPCFCTSKISINLSCATLTHRKLPRIIQVLCSMHPEAVREYNYINSQLHETVYNYITFAVHRDYSSPGRTGYVNIAVHHEYLSPSRSGSTSTTSCVRMPRHIAPLVVDYSASRRLVVDYFDSATRPGASARRAARHVARCAARCRLLRLAQAHRRLLRLRRASGCLGLSRSSSRGSSRRSSSTTPPRAGSSSTTSPPPRVWVPQHITWLVASLVVDYSTSRGLVVDYSTYTTRPGASARRAARHAARCAARRRLLHLAQAHRRLLCLRRASGCLGTSRGSSRGSSRRSSSTTPPRAGSSSTTSTPPRVRVPRLVARLVAPLVVDYFAYATRPGA
jgi:hypothetical protein